LLIGAFYFGTVALYRRQEKRYLLLPIAALFAVGQLLAEVSRGLIQYDYPYHDVRLVFILLFATATGMCLLIHIIDRFDCRHKTLVVIASLVITATAIFTEDAFSAKTLRALQVPAVIGVIVAGNAFRLGKSKALNYAISLLIFSIIIQPVLNAFLDIYFFYLVAGLLTYLFVQQIRINELEKQQLAVERSRAERLQQILEENDEKQSPSVIKVSASGRIELIPADKIIYCKSAVDYVELFVEGKGSILRTGSLSELEKELPSVFLRVHRSYVVNSAFVKSLKREPNGAGYLLLATGVEVPVSRRIMPSVRRALN
jgi:DNA-binding LytR/AlgR family response regulator